MSKQRLRRHEPTTQPDGPPASGRVRIERTGPIRARFEAIAPDGRVLVRWGDREPTAAVLATAESHETLLEAVRSRREALVDFIEGDPEQPVVLAVLRDRLDVDEPAPRHVNEPVIEIEAGEHLTLRCGQSALVLRRDGRVAIEGTQIDSSATGAHRIRGGSVGIN